MLFSNEEWPLAEHLLKEGLKAAPPRKPFVACVLRGELIVVYARIVESLRELGYAHILLGAAAYEEVAQLTVDKGAVLKHATVAAVDVEAVDGTTEQTQPSEAVEVR